MTNGRFLGAMVEAAVAAGDEIERIYAEGCEPEEKCDGSPVTVADRNAERIILERLARLDRAIPVLAEEEAAEGRIPVLGDLFFLVDPLDGTRGFIERNGEFTVNIALIKNGVPMAGVIYAPDSGALYYGAAGEGAFRRFGRRPVEPIRPRPHPRQGLTAIASRSNAVDTEARLKHLAIAKFVPSSSSLKFCLLAEGSADVYPRFGPTMEWDTGAGQAILEAVGGRVMVFEGSQEIEPLRYGKVERGFLNPHFIAWGV